MNASTDSHNALGGLFSQAYASHSTMTVPPELTPATMDDAYAVQQCFLQQSKARIGGWKIGSKSDSGPVQGAPLPLQGMHRSGAVVKRSDHQVLGLELEIAFCFAHEFTPRAGEISQAEVMQSIGKMGTSIEIVSSRLTGWPQVPPLTQLADFQNHGALITGDFIAYRDDFPFLHPMGHLTLDDKDIFKGAGANPAGDPRRLLTWLVNHCSQRGIVISAETVITTGTYSGIYFVEQSGLVTGKIDGLPPIEFELR